MVRRLELMRFVSHMDICGDCLTGASIQAFPELVRFSSVVQPGRGLQGKAALEAGVAHADAGCFCPRQGVCPGLLLASVSSSPCHLDNCALHHCCDVRDRLKTMKIFKGSQVIYTCFTRTLERVCEVVQGFGKLQVT